MKLGLGRITFVEITVLIMFCPFRLQAGQPVKAGDWISIGLGAASVATDSPGLFRGGMIHGRLALNSAFSQHTFLTAAVAGHVEAWPTIFLAPHDRIETVNEFALMIGQRAAARHIGYASVSTGLAVTNGQARVAKPSVNGKPQTGMENRTGFGVPVDMQLVFAPVSFIGIGVRGFANFNTDRSFSGVSFNLYLGRIW